MADAANNDTIWPRDYVADANPDLTRKRQKLSEEVDDTTHDSSSLSTAQSPDVVALPPDEVGHTYHNLITLQNESGADMAISFDEGPILAPGTPLSSLQQLDYCLSSLNEGKVIQPQWIDALQEWLRDHLDQTAHVPGIWYQAYSEHADLYARIASLTHALFASTVDRFERDVLSRSGIDRLRTVMDNLYADITELSTRLVAIMPRMVDFAVARMESGQSAHVHQPLPLLEILNNLVQTITLHGTDFAYFETLSPRFKPVVLRNAECARLREDTSTLDSLATLLEKLATHHAAITNSWPAIFAIMRIFNCLKLDKCVQLEKVLGTIHMHIFPAISEKHPRALPNGFHRTAVVAASRALTSLLKDCDDQGIAALYDAYIKAEEDALLSETESHLPTARLLRNVSNGDQQIVVELIQTSYVLQALRHLVFSAIMDVRSSGISQLSNRLLALWERHRNEAHCEHPVLQYVARFMRKNELTKYIFGPNSHATLISHSQHIIGFLAATGAYTDLETDIIWHACTNSVEAEFSKASFLVLADVRRFLDLDQLLYLARKYVSTPLSKMGRDAVDFLARLLELCQLKAELPENCEKLMAVAFISMDIMSRIDRGGSGPLALQLRTVARNELRRFMTNYFSAENRVQIYKRCTLNVLATNEDASTSTEILAMFLREFGSYDESAAELGHMLPLSAVISELGTFVDRVRSDSYQNMEALAQTISDRIELISHLMTLPNVELSAEGLNEISIYTIGELALNNFSRDCAWRDFAHWSRQGGRGCPAWNVLRKLQSEAAVHLPLEWTPCNSLKLFAASLQEQAKTTAVINDYSSILQMPEWKKLVEAAESSGFPDIDDLASDLLCNILFEEASPYQNKVSIARCHASFARRQIERICSMYAAMVTEQPNIENEQIVVRTIALLDAVLLRSKQSGSTYITNVSPDLCLVHENAEDSLFATLQVYGGGHPQPKIYHLQYLPSTKLGELLTAMPEITGAAENRVILNGQSLDFVICADKELSELGLQPRGVICICPKHTMESDLKVMLASAGAVEQELLAQWEDLEKLIGGPDAIAKQMLHLLGHARVPAQSRHRVVSLDVSIQDIFPTDRIWRTLFSIFILKTHLTDFTQLGVAEEKFLLHGVRLLEQLIVEKDRPNLLQELPSAIDCLIAFLQEQPKEPSSPLLIDNARRFVNRIVDICFHALELPQEQRKQCRALLELTLRLLMEAFRRQTSLWSSFKEHPRNSDLHKRLLFNEDDSIVNSASHAIRSFSLDMDSADDVAEFYMGTLMNCLLQALETPTHWYIWSLTSDIMHANRKLRVDEVQARRVFNALINFMWRYQHTESVDLPMTDRAMCGLLKLVDEATAVLRSFKKPLKLHELPLKIFNTLLFPPLKSPSSRPLVSAEGRKAGYQLIQGLCESPEDFEALLEATKSSLQCASGDSHSRYPGDAEWLRPAVKCSGLTNLGMTCYMNSLLQQLYANVHFRKFIFDTELADPATQELLDHVQQLFAQMQNDYEWTSNTFNLAKILNVQVDSQEDVHGFYEDFLSKLEASMPDEAAKTTLRSFFTGKLISQIKGECGHVSPKTEPFVDLPIIVKNKTSLEDSLQEFVQGEPMEGTNKYKCMACDAEQGGRLVNAMKRACPEEVPDNLTFCLKRFSFEAMLGIDGKVNDRFEFPQSIDMSRYHRKHLDAPEAEIYEDAFELVGVIVHQGTLNLGHYWSYVLLRNTGAPQTRTWVKLEDRFVHPVEGGVQEVQRECFGGSYTNGIDRTDNAYVLFYQRKSSLEEQIALPGPTHDPTMGYQLPPKIGIPERLATQIHDQNEWRHRIAQLFDNQLDGFVRFLLSSYPRHRVDTPVQSETGSQDGGEIDQAATISRPSSSSDHLIKLLSETAVAYVQRIAVADSAGAVKPKACFAVLRKLIAEQPRFAILLLDLFTADSDWFSGVITRNENAAVRGLVCEFVLTALANIREQDAMIYQELFERLAISHAWVMDNFDVSLLDVGQYLGFAAGLAALGSNETAMVLDRGYLVWAFELMRIPMDNNLKKHYRGMEKIFKLNPDKMSALYTFVHAILDGHASFSDPHALDDRKEPLSPHLIIDDAIVQLQYPELEWILSCYADMDKQDFVWLRMTHLAQYPKNLNKWQEHAPGKLLRLFMHPEKSPAQIREQVDEAFLKHVEREENCLQNLLHLVLNYLSVATTQCASRVLASLATSLPDWDGQALHAIYFARLAMVICPVACAANLVPWVFSFLTHDKASVRRATEEFLNDKVFEGATLTDNPTFNSTRWKVLRYLVRRLTEVANEAYKNEEPRTQWENVISVLATAEKWMTALHDEGRREMRNGNREGKLDYMLKVDLGELSGQILRVNEANSLFAEWSAEEDDDDVVEIGRPAIVLRSGIRSGTGSVRLRSDEEEITDEDEEEWSDSPGR